MPELSSAVLAFEKAQELSARVDAFFNRREERYKRKEAKKAAKRAKRDGDTYAPEERSELRTGALSKGE